MVNCSLGLLDQVAIAGNSTATTRGIYSPAGTQVTSGVVGINGFDFGVYLTGTGANLNGGTVYACGNLTAGLSANYGAAVNLTFSICSAMDHTEHTRKLALLLPLARVALSQII